MRTRLLALAMTGLCAASLACGGKGEAPRASQGAPTRVDIGLRPFLYDAPLDIALAEGFFADAGLDVHVHMLAGHSTTSFLALDHGEIDALVAGTSLGLFTSAERGSRFRLVAGVATFAPDTCSPWALVAQRDLARRHALPGPAALRGRRIDVNPVITEGYFVDLYLRRGGLSLADVEVAEVPLASRQDAMNRGSIDLTAISEPWLSRILADGHQVQAAANEIVPGLDYVGLYFGRRLLGPERDAGRRFVAAYLRGVRQYMQGKKPRNLDIVARATGLDRATLERACWATAPPDGAIDLEPLQAYQRWGVQRGLIDRVVPPDAWLDAGFTRSATDATPADDP